MRKALIKLASKQVIDAASPGAFARKVFQDTYSEFLLQVQTYNREGRYTTFRELATHVPKALSLHYKVGFAVGLYVRELNHLIPGLHDSLGRINLPFTSHEFELIDSNVTRQEAHAVAITYHTDALTLLGTVGEYLMLALGEAAASATGPVETFLLQVGPGLSITSYQEV